MTRVGRMALVLALALGLGLLLGPQALADHAVGHDHPDCAQGGGPQAGDSEATAEFLEDHFANAVEDEDSFSAAEHLAGAFGDDPELLARIQHGGHGEDESGGGQGGALLGGGDGGCEPEIFDDDKDIDHPRRFVPTRQVPGRRLPTTGASAEQFALMGAVFLALGAAFVFAPQIVSGVNGRVSKLFARKPVRTQATPAPEAPTQTVTTVPSDPAPTQPAKPTNDAISRLQEEVSRAWQRAS